MSAALIEAFGARRAGRAALELSVEGDGRGTAVVTMRSELAAQRAIRALASWSVRAEILSESPGSVVGL